MGTAPSDRQGSRRFGYAVPIDMVTTNRGAGQGESEGEEEGKHEQKQRAREIATAGKDTHTRTGTRIGWDGMGGGAAIVVVARLGRRLEDVGGTLEVDDRTVFKGGCRPDER